MNQLLLSDIKVTDSFWWVKVTVVPPSIVSLPALVIITELALLSVFFIVKVFPPFDVAAYRVMSISPLVAFAKTTTLAVVTVVSPVIVA